MYYLTDYVEGDIAEFGVKQLLKNLRPKTNSLVGQRAYDETLAKTVADGMLPSADNLVEIGKSFKNPVKGFQRGLRRDRLSRRRLRETGSSLTRQTAIEDGLQRGKEYLTSRPEWVTTLETKLPATATGIAASTQLGASTVASAAIGVASQLPFRQISRDITSTLDELKRIPKGTKGRFKQAVQQAGKVRRANTDQQIRDFYSIAGGGVIGTSVPKIPGSTSFSSLPTGMPPAMIITPKLTNTMSDFYQGKISGMQVPKRIYKSFRKSPIEKIMEVKETPDSSNSIASKFKNYVESFKQEN